MREFFRRWWPVLKLLLAVAIVAAVGWQFVRILGDPHLQAADHRNRPPWQVFADTLSEARPDWLLAAAGLYALGMCLSLAFWAMMLRVLGQHPPVAGTVRAYFIGHLGKYLPGKAWALLLRTTLVAGPRVRVGVAALTATYETLTMMASGALVAAVLLTWTVGSGEALLWRAVGLLALAGIPILPGVFNVLVRRVSAPFLKSDAAPLPPLRHSTLLVGLALTAGEWVLFGLSLGAVLTAIQPDAVAWAWPNWGRWTAFVALAYVAGFLTLPAPGGLGVRELILQQCLQPELGPAMSVVVVLVVRLLWTVAEVVIAAGVFWLPSAARNRE